MSSKGLTPHNRAAAGDFADTVLMPGDPLRAKYIAETFLENARLVTDVRNMFGYTGTYHGREISVMGSGMGVPSIGIYATELYTQFNVDAIIRIGSAGGIAMPTIVGALADHYGFAGGMTAILVAICMLVLCSAINVGLKRKQA